MRSQRTGYTSTGGCPGPATGDDRARLKEARRLAAWIVGGDASNVPAVHPLRWPGSWHRKAEPRMCEIAHVEPDREIGLDEALAALEAARRAGDPYERVGREQTQEPPADLDEAVGKIIDGEELHDSTLRLAASLIANGASESVAARTVRAVLNASRAPRDRRWQERFDDVERLVASAQEKYGPDRQPKGPLRWLDMSKWDTERAPPREWTINEIVPRRQFGGLAGPGGTGKSIIELMKDVCHVIGHAWFDWEVTKGPAIYVGAEDEADELHRRIEAIVEYYGTTFEAVVSGGLHVLPVFGEDALMSVVGKSGRLETTALYKQIYEAVGDIKPVNISLDSLSRILAASENDRPIAYAFAQHMQALALVGNLLGDGPHASEPARHGVGVGHVRSDRVA